MRATIENIGRRASDGACVLKVIVPNDIDAEQIRLGSIELEQQKYEQKTLS